MIAELEAYIADLTGQLRGLDRQLAPVYARQESIKVQIACTHETIENEGHVYVVQVNLSAAAIELRQPGWTELDRLAAVHGPALTRRKELAAELKGLKRRLERAKKDADKAARKAARKPIPPVDGGSGLDLFSHGRGPHRP